MYTFSDVFCTYTGGGVYCVTARLGDNLYLSSDLDLYGTYDVPYADIEAKYNCDYDSHWVTVTDPLPTWRDLLNAVIESHHNGGSRNMSVQEFCDILQKHHPDLSVPMNNAELKRPGPDQDDNSSRLETIATFIDAFEDFLEFKGVDIKNPERDDDPCASLIYGTDYAVLSDKIEDLLIRYGVLKSQ